MKRKNITVTTFSRKGRMKKHIVSMVAGLIMAAISAVMTFLGF